MIAAEQAARDWTNAVPGLTGRGRPLANGCFLAPPPHSPAEGAWALLSRATPGGQEITAEPGAASLARIQWDVYCGDEVAAEQAAAALASAVETLTGDPQRAGESALILVHDNLAGPVFVPQPGDSAEPYCFQVQADLLMSTS